MSATCISCPYCEAFTAPSQRLLERHIRVTHYQDPGFKIKCNHVSCCRVFTNYRTYQNHLLKHKKDDNTTRLADDLPEGSNATEDISSAADDSVPEDNDDNLLNLDLTNFCAKWILRISETRKLTRTATVGIVQDVSDLLMEVSACIKEQVRKCLQENEINFEAIRGMNDVFSSDNVYISPFSHLSTFQQQLAYYKEHYHFIVSYHFIFNYFCNHM